MRFDPWIVICTSIRIGIEWAFSDRDDLRVNLRACGWSDADVDALLDAENPDIYDAHLVRIDAGAAEYAAGDGCVYRVHATGQAEYIRAILES